MRHGQRRVHVVEISLPKPNDDLYGLRRAGHAEARVTPLNVSRIPEPQWGDAFEICFAEEVLLFEFRPVDSGENLYWRGCFKGSSILQSSIILMRCNGWHFHFGSAVTGAFLWEDLLTDLYRQFGRPTGEAVANLAIPGSA
jgi:hypothetical protein